MADEETAPMTVDPAFMWGVQPMFKYGGPHRMEEPKFKTIGFAQIPMIEVVVWLPKSSSVGDILPLARQSVIRYVKDIPDALEYVHFRPGVSSGSRRAFHDQDGTRRFGIRHEIHFEVDKPLADHLKALEHGELSRMDIYRLGLQRRRPEVRVHEHQRRA